MPSCCCPSAGRKGPEQVRPFLENVTRGPQRAAGTPGRRRRALPAFRRGVADQRDQPRADHRAASRNWTLPVYFGNRNWEPYVEDTVAAMRDNGVRRAAVFTTSAWSGYSELHAVRRRHRPGAPGGRAGRARAGQAAAVLRPPAVRRDVRRRPSRPPPTPCPPTRGWCSPRIRSRWPPTSACGPRLYSRQVAYAARLVAAAAGYADYDLVWQSRSGPPQVPWLEPDVAEHLAALAARGHQGRHRVPDRVRRRPHRGGVGSRRGVALPGRGGGDRVRPGRHTQRRSPIRPAGRRSDRRTAHRPNARRGWPAPTRCRVALASVDGAPCRPPHCVAESRELIVPRPSAGSR